MQSLPLHDSRTFLRTMMTKCFSRPPARQLFSPWHNEFTPAQRRIGIFSRFILLGFLGIQNFWINRSVTRVRVFPSFVVNQLIVRQQQCFSVSVVFTTLVDMMIAVIFGGGALVQWCLITASSVKSHSLVLSANQLQERGPCSRVVRRAGLVLCYEPGYTLFLLRPRLGKAAWLHQAHVMRSRCIVVSQPRPLLFSETLRWLNKAAWQQTSVNRQTKGDEMFSVLPSSSAWSQTNCCEETLMIIEKVGGWCCEDFFANLASWAEPNWIATAPQLHYITIHTPTSMH